MLQALTFLSADEDQRLLLYVDYVCTNMGLSVPWDDIAAKMEPRDPALGEKPMTGEAIKQHIAKLRGHRESKGYDVPPKLDRNARRQAAEGKNTLQTPAPTPRKVGPFPPFMSARSKPQIPQGETAPPVKKESSLLAPLSKSKQKKAEKAMKAQFSGISNHTSATNARALKGTTGGVKTTNGKRGRRPAAAAEEDEYRDFTSIGVTADRQLRQPERKDYTGMAPDSEGIGIKDEPESDDDLPLSKRRNTTQKSGGGRKKAVVSLFVDTVNRWNNRDAAPVADESADKSPEAAPAVEPSENNLGDDVNHPRVTHAAPPADTGLPFHRDADFQAAEPYGCAGDGFGADPFRTNWPQNESGHPSPLDDSFMMGPRMSAPHGPVHGFGLQGGGGFMCPQTSPTFGHVSQQTTSHELPCTSSPLFGNLSSGTFAPTDFGSGFGSDYSQLPSRITSQKSSFSNTQDLHDPFGANSRNVILGGLPLVPLSEWATPSHQLTSPADFETGHQYPDYTDSQVSPAGAGPTLTPSGLGISMPQSSGANFLSPIIANTNQALPSTEVHDSRFTQSVPSNIGMDIFGVPSPRDHAFSFNDFVDDIETHAGFAPLPSNDFVNFVG